jgi:hypothetical protein
MSWRIGRVNTIKKKAEASVVSRKKTGLEVNVDNVWTSQ